MLTLYQQLFSGLLESQVTYCVWKNVQELPDALAGHGDIDLYISPGSRVRFITELRAHGFTRFISSKATPCVEHYYGFDATSGKFCHLHCYFRIVTGESHIKQYVIPVEDYLPTLPSTQNSEGVCEMHPMLQYKLNLFRRSIKLSCLPGAILFYRERRGYEQERQLLEQALSQHADTGSSNAESGWLANIRTSTTLQGEIVAGLRNRIHFRHWNRFPALVTPVYRYGTILLRLAAKLRRRRKMLPTGIVVAVTGPSMDDAKMLENRLASWLGEHFDLVTLNHHRRVNSVLRHVMGGSIVIWSGHSMEARPDVDIILRLPDLSAPDTTRRPVFNGSVVAGNYPIELPISDCGSSHESTWKHEVWQALIALQP